MDAFFAAQPEKEKKTYKCYQNRGKVFAYRFSAPISQYLYSLLPSRCLARCKCWFQDEAVKAEVPGFV